MNKDQNIFGLSPMTWLRVFVGGRCIVFGAAIFTVLWIGSYVNVPALVDMPKISSSARH